MAIPGLTLDTAALVLEVDSEIDVPVGYFGYFCSALVVLAYAIAYQPMLVK